MTKIYLLHGISYMVWPDCRGAEKQYSMSPENEGYEMRFGEHSIVSTTLSLEEVKFTVKSKSLLMA